MKKYVSDYVTGRPDLWKEGDPVQPNLDSDFKSALGREVVGLKDEAGKWKAFLCYARTSDVPSSIEELDNMTDPLGKVVVPYTVWSLEKGAGRAIINEVLWMVENVDTDVERVVTLSPPTMMARNFHLKNGAKEFRVNDETVNFEYNISKACN